VGVVAIDDQDGAVDADFALGLVARHDAALAARLRAGFGSMVPPAGAPRLRPSDWIAERGPADVARILSAAAALRDALDAHARDWADDPDYREAVYAARMTWQNIRVFELSVKGSDVTAAAPEYWSRRDRFMAENLFDRLGANRRAALWAHDDHVMHTFPPEWTRQGATALGVEVRRRLGQGYRTIGFTYTRATLTGVLGANMDLKQLVARQVDRAIPVDNGGPDTTGRALARLPGDAWWFDTATPVPDAGARRWLARPAWSGSAGWFVDAVRFQAGKVAEDGSPPFMGFDILVWFRTMTPQHRWPVAPEPSTP
jgi:erythromycin esterase